MAPGVVIWAARNKHLAENSSCTTTGHEPNFRIGQRVGPKNKISHHGDLEQLDVCDLTHLAGRNPLKLILVDRVVQKASFDFEGDVIVKLGSEHQSGGKARLHRDVSADSKVGIVN